MGNLSTALLGIGLAAHGLSVFGRDLFLVGLKKRKSRNL
jgi:hypothetical protein